MLQMLSESLENRFSQNMKSDAGDWWSGMASREVIICWVQTDKQVGKGWGKCIPSGRNSMCKGMVVFNNIIVSGAFVSSCCSVAKSRPTLCDPHRLRHTQLPCPSPSSRVCSDSCLLSRACLVNPYLHYAFWTTALIKYRTYLIPLTQTVLLSLESMCTSV